MSFHLGDFWTAVVQDVGLLAAAALVLTLVTREAALLSGRGRAVGVRALLHRRATVHTCLGLFLAAGVLQVLTFL